MPGGSPSGTRPPRSPIKTRTSPNGKAPVRNRAFTRKTTQYGEGPLNGEVHMNTAPTNRTLPPVPEYGVVATGPSWEGIFVWTLTIALVIVLTWNSADWKLPPVPKSFLTTPPAMNTGVPFTLVGFFRRAFSVDF